MSHVLVSVVRDVISRLIISDRALIIIIIIIIVIIIIVFIIIIIVFLIIIVVVVVFVVRLGNRNPDSLNARKNARSAPYINP